MVTSTNGVSSDATNMEWAMSNGSGESRGDFVRPERYRHKHDLSLRTNAVAVRPTRATQRQRLASEPVRR